MGYRFALRIMQGRGQCLCVKTDIQSDKVKLGSSGLWLHLKYLFWNQKQQVTNYAEHMTESNEKNYIFIETNSSLLYPYKFNLKIKFQPVFKYFQRRIHIWEPECVHSVKFNCEIVQ